MNDHRCWSSKEMKPRGLSNFLIHKKLNFTVRNVSEFYIQINYLTKYKFKKLLKSEENFRWIFMNKIKINFIRNSSLIKTLELISVLERTKFDLILVWKNLGTWPFFPDTKVENPWVLELGYPQVLLKLSELFRIH